MRLVIVVYEDGFPIWEEQYPVHEHATPATLVQVTKAIPGYALLVMVDGSDPVAFSEDKKRKDI